MALFLTPDKELDILNGTYNRIVGVDEVGRGAWAGPVMVGVYEFTQDTPRLEGIKDSKLLSEKKKQSLYKELQPHDYKVKYANPKQIDENGIGQALHQLITNVIEEYSDPETLILIDGYFKDIDNPNVRLIVKGDLTHYSIAAASIVAKVERDAHMKELSEKYPEYGFEKHVGYGTKAHRLAMEEYGVLEGIHRFSYKPVQKLLHG